MTSALLASGFMLGRAPVNFEATRAALERMIGAFIRKHVTSHTSFLPEAQLREIMGRDSEKRIFDAVQQVRDCAVSSDAGRKTGTGG
jgi:hypothetical protein